MLLLLLQSWKKLCFMGSRRVAAGGQQWQSSGSGRAVHSSAVPAQHNEMEMMSS
jgi:hypothetical protein